MFTAQGSRAKVSRPTSTLLSLTTISLRLAWGGSVAGHLALLVVRWGRLTPVDVAALVAATGLSLVFFVCQPALTRQPVKLLIIGLLIALAHGPADSLPLAASAVLVPAAIAVERRWTFQRLVTETCLSHPVRQITISPGQSLAIARSGWHAAALFERPPPHL
jgi:hypothetical protein